MSWLLILSKQSARCHLPLCWSWSFLRLSYW